MGKRLPPGKKKAEKLTERQIAFIEHYLIDFNATKAAIKAGLSESHAASWGCTALKDPKVQEGLAEARNARSKRTQVTADKVLRELARIAFSDMSDFATIDVNRNVVFTPSEKMKPGKSRVIKSLSQSVNQFGGSQQIVLHDKIQALKLCGLHLGLFKGVGAEDEGDDETIPPLAIDMSGENLPDDHKE